MYCIIILWFLPYYYCSSHSLGTVISRPFLVNFDSCLGQTSGFASVQGRQALIKRFVYISQQRCPSYHSFTLSPINLVLLDCNFVHCIHCIGTSHWNLSYWKFPLVSSHWTLLDWNQHHWINGCTTSSTVPHWIASSLAYLN